MENLGYMEVSHNKISLDLLYDMYDEGKKDSGSAFDTKKSKKL